MRRPLCVDLFSGLHGWAEAFVSEGYHVVAFDIVDMCAALGKPRSAGIDLVLQDVATLHGAQFRNAACIVASPPCQAYSYRAMPWKRAKELPPPDNTLFEACFRIQAEASAAAGRHIPLIVENVRGAQRWVGRARWRYNSFYLWGDVPALMPFASGRKVPMNFHEHERTGAPGRSFQSVATKMAAAGDGLTYGGGFGWDGSAMRTGNSRSDARKAASALIARIPFDLAAHIARTFKPRAGGAAA